MIKNYLKIAWRNLKRNKAYAFISVTGLALGVTCGILIFTLISYHLSFDNFHKNPDRIYRFYTEWHDGTVGMASAVPQPLGKAYRANFNLSEKTARIISYSGTLISLPGKDIKKFEEKDGVAFTEPEYFDILNFPLIQGDKRNILAKPNQALITENIAKKYWGTSDVIGNTIRLDNKISFTVTGILKDLPANTDRKQEIYVSYANLDEYTDKRHEDAWGGVYSGSQAFTLLKPNVSVERVNAALAQLVKMNFKGRDAKVWNFKIQPLSDIHFNADLDGYADRKYLWALFFIGLFLIITACVNFVNLATAQALNRAKEVGIRKVLGSLPRQLFWQFIAETALITLVATFFAVILAEVSLPLINNLFQSKMQFNWALLAPFIFIIILIVVFLSGSYPGLVLARFQPILALKSKLSQKHIGGFSLRRVLVVVQFSISQVLIIGTIIVVAQLHYSQNTDLGFNKNAIVMVPLPTDDLSKMKTLLNRFNEVNGVEKATLCYSAPASQSNSTTGVNFDHRAEDEHGGINVKAGDVNYLSLFGLKLVAGRNFFAADTTRELLVNETFVKKLNLKPKDVIGKILSIDGHHTTAPIVGVVKDFYNYSFHTEISPICISPNYHSYSNVALKINMHSANSSLASIEKIWNNTFPDELYSYSFLDDSIAKFYEMDNILLKLIEAFAAIAILIGCLGLYGLVSFMAVRKTKEIGVRKVLGASIQHILWLFGKEFCKLLLIAFFIAAPIAWWAMNNYLKDFVYKISIGPSIFLLSIASTFIIAAITVGYRATVAAVTNPVKSLRSE
ncbi:FtsX-like permease family protein [Mucilaginibacter corticis]|uniref:FtsX-like permease family protein n=1 Tax=Mucilaginibacter corticis TaxID=2597670 RepID=A0A556MT81_9SPHI|nr:ABC transporter permease [Mucilaginibacter corticis]TSJ43042.1 FtsX-like permease family protein [Mucilaginibacter corticis]